MAKIFSAKAELTVLRGLFHKNKAIVGTLLSTVDESYFYREEGVEVYEKIKDSVAEDGEVPRYKVLLEDPDLSEDARAYLRESQAIIGTTSDAKKAVSVLNKYRKRRGLHSIAHRIDTALQEGRTDLADLEDEISEALGKVRAAKATKDAFLHFGKNSNSREFVRSFLRDPVGDIVIPTGIKSYDKTNEGFIRSSLVLLGGNSGSGKSHMATALAVNMASMGYKVLIVPLEMSKHEMTARIMANVTKTDSMRLSFKKLSEEEINKVDRKFLKWNKKIKAKGGRLTVFKPDSDITIEETFASISSYAVDVVIIDYISLLAGADGDDQWRQLGAIARYAKINAELNNRVNILLAQISDEGKLKYSQTMKEHASNMWTFVADADSKEQGILKVEQPKSRNQVSFPFTIKIEYAYSRVLDIENDFEHEPDEGTKKSKKAAPNLAASPDV